ncbi:MAG: ATP-binding cassette domain-containing protein [Clostridia bacterium]|nr:ATP-binding cassette domain-containing protein [Clostridia bacterium]
MRCGLEGVSFSYHGEGGLEIRVLDKVDLPLPERGGVCLTGPSGCGKTTALRLLAGLEAPGEGRVAGLQGRRLAVLFQENRLLPWSSVLENVVLGMGGGRGGENLPRARVLLDAVGLADQANQLPGELSGGMKRRVALARMLARGGDVLLLDEPLKELDADTGSRMRLLIREHARGKLLVLITHDLRDAEALCDTVITCSGPPLRIVG